MKTTSVLFVSCLALVSCGGTDDPPCTCVGEIKPACAEVCGPDLVGTSGNADTGGAGGAGGAGGIAAGGGH
jgi:hypothetical protein